MRSKTKVVLQQHIDAITAVGSEVVDDCHIWNGSFENGYATYAKMRVSRIVLTEKLGRQLGESLALHTCDNPQCINPDHLYEGTPQDNMRDRYERDGYTTQAKGEKAGPSKLTTKEVNEIRRIGKIGSRSKAELSRLYKTTPANIAAILSGKTWKCLL